MLGTNLLIAVSRKAEPAFDMGLLMLIVLPAVTVITQSVDQHLIVPFDITYLRLLVMVLLIPISVLLMVQICGRLLPIIKDRMHGLVSLVMANSTVLGTAMLAYNNDMSIPQALFFGVGTALGFTLILLTFTAIREKVAVSDVPRPFKGIAILIITLGLMSMAYLGFKGITVLP
jgi:electron transport complex protein RnfA